MSGIWQFGIESATHEWYRTIWYWISYTWVVSYRFWLTTYLSIQRYISVKYPFKKKVLFTKRNNVIVCASIVLSALILHSYYLVKGKVNDGTCDYTIETPCYESCVYMLASVLLQHIIPCILLTTTTVLLVRQLYVNETSVISRRQENRQVSKIVIAIAVVFLIQEVPIGLSTLYFFYKIYFRYSR